MRDDSDAHEHMPVNRNVVLAVLVSGAFVIILNQTLLNTALPAFMEDFGITANAAQWVTTIFMLVNGIMIPVSLIGFIGSFFIKQSHGPKSPSADADV